LKALLPPQKLGKFRVIAKHKGFQFAPYLFPNSVLASDIPTNANPDFFIGANQRVLLCDGNASLPIQLLKIASEGDPLALPIAVDDTIEVDFETEFNFDPRVNDAGVGIEVTDVSNPSYGTTTLEVDGTISYLPDNGYWGSDSFTYEITDDEANEATATVTVTVNPPAELMAHWDASLLIGADDDPIGTLPDIVGDLDFIATTPEAYRIFRSARSGSSVSNVYWWGTLRTGSSAGPIVEDILLGPSIADPPNYFLPAYDIIRSFEFWLTIHTGDINGPISGSVGVSQQSPLITAPTLQLAAQNGLNTLLFASSAAMAAAINSNWGITDAGTIFLVLKQISGTGPIFNFDNPSNDNRFGFYYDLSGSLHIMWGNVTAATGHKTVVYAVDTDWTILTLRRDVNAFELFRDGASIWTPTAFASALIWNGASALSLANSSQALSTFKSFELGEMIVFPSALSAPDRLSIETYLGGKWGITI
jgi:hypothetical protein